MRIRISWPQGQVIARLKDSPTARRISHTLPYTAKAQTWGEEVYFKLPVQAEIDPSATDVVDPGTVCYWVAGQSLALPFGRTPASQGDECRLVERVNILGTLEDDAKQLATVKDGDNVRVQLLGQVSWE